PTTARICLHTLSLHDALPILPREVTSGRHLESWWKKSGRRDPESLRMHSEDIRTAHAAPSATDFPPTWRQGDRTFDLRYEFDPGDRKSTRLNSSHVSISYAVF